MDLGTRRRNTWARVAGVICAVSLLPAAAFGEGAHSPENSTIVLGLLGGVALCWQYLRSRSTK